MHCYFEANNIEKKGIDLIPTQSYNKIPYTNGKFKKETTTQKRPNMFANTVTKATQLVLTRLRKKNFPLPALAMHS